jgi:hypothetical protein
LYTLARIKPGEYATARLKVPQPAIIEWPLMMILGNSRSMRIKREPGLY